MASPLSVIVRQETQNPGVKASDFAIPDALVNPKAKEQVMQNDAGFIFRQCITLRNGQRICKPKGQAFRIPISNKLRTERETANDN
ncbi:MAG: hypothetical protein ACK4Z8_11765 [Novosphingobium sp.]